MGAYTTFGDFIRQERVRAGLKLSEAARQLGISPSYLSRLEAGDFKPPSGTLLLRMAQVYGSDIKKLMDLARNRESEVMAADSGASTAVQAFYRLAHDQPVEMQEKMLRAAVDALDLPPSKKAEMMAQLRAMLSRSHGQELLRLARDELGLFAFDIAPRFLSRQGIRDFAGVVLRRVFSSEIPIPVPMETIIDKLAPDVILVVHDEMEGGRLRNGSPAVLGLSRWSRDGERRELVIHEELFDAPDAHTRRRANFTLAHELFHCVEHLPLVQLRNPEVVFARKIGYVTFAPELTGKKWYDRHKGPRKLSTREDWREWQANTFAAELLMPAESVTAAFLELFGVERLEAEGENLGRFADETARCFSMDDFGNETTLVERFDVNPQAMAIRLMSLGLVVEDSSS